MASLRIIGGRLLVSLVLSQIAGGLMMLAQQLIEGIHSLDRWHAARIYSVIGVIAGTIIGLLWGIVAALDKRSTVNPSAAGPDPPS